MTLAHFRSLVRRDLRDTAPGDQRWDDAELDRHILHAVRDLSHAVPLQAAASVTATGGRDLALDTLLGLLEVRSVEHVPTGGPARALAFRQWAGALTFLDDPPPPKGEQLHIAYTRLHTVDKDGTTVPAALEDTIALGAAAYAALAWANYAINRVNLGGADTARRYQAWGSGRLEDFRAALRQATRRQGLGTRRLTTPGSH